MKPSVRHVVLITYGEPPRAGFGSQLKYSWRILLGLTRSVAPIPLPLLPVIALSRARNRVRLWTAERYRSPLEPITRAQAAALGAALGVRAPGIEWRTHVAYEFRDPLLPDVLDGIPRDEAVDVLPMYVADSAFTHEITRRAVEQWKRGRGANRAAPVTVLPALDEERFAAVAAGHVLAEAARRGAGGRDWALVLAAHGTLLEPPRPFETGRLATERVAALIAERCGARFGLVQLGWLNHVYGGEWTKPAAEVALEQVVAAGFRKVVYFPFGFSADNAESELEGRLALRTQPELEAIHLPCVNGIPEHVESLAELVIAGAGVERAPEAAELRAAR